LHYNTAIYTQENQKMSKHTMNLICIALIILLIGTILTACGSSSSNGSGSSGGSTDGLSLMQSHCSVCHSTDRITTAHKTADQWKTTVDRMISHGAQLTPAEEQTLVAYLAATYK
jgi:mono/diheme cytochrome c family protein